MDNTVKTVIVIAVVILVGLPLGAKLYEGTAAAPKAEDKVAAKPIVLEPPYWNAGNLSGTQWTGSFNGIAATLSLQSGGIAALASDNMLVRTMVPSGKLQGTWSVDGAKFTLEAEIPKMGKKKVTGTISGKQILDDKGAPLPLQQIK